MSDAFSTADIESFVSRFYKGLPLLLTPYGYTSTFLALAQNAQATNVLNIQANADFVLLAVKFRSQIGAAQTVTNKTAPFVRILLIDSGSNEQFTNAPVDITAYSPSLYEGALPYPRILAGRSTLTIQVTNYAPTAETYTSLDIYLSGLLVRELSAQP